MMEKVLEKWPLRITPFFMNRQNKYLGLIIRELFFGILLALAYVFLLIAGANWIDFYNNLIYSPDFIEQYNAAFPDYEMSKVDWISFDVYIEQLFSGGPITYGGTEIANDNIIHTYELGGSYEYHYWQYQMYQAYQVTITISLAVILFIWLTMLFSKDKRGFHDIVAQTTVVEDNSIMTETKYQKVFEPESLMEFPVKAHEDLTEYLKEDGEKTKKATTYEPLTNTKTNPGTASTDYVGNTADWFKRKKEKIKNLFRKKPKPKDSKNTNEIKNQNDEKIINENNNKVKEINNLNNEKNKNDEEKK